MKPFQSQLNLNTEPFKTNRHEMLEQVEQLRELGARAALKSAKSRPKFDKRKQLLPRERLSRLLDPGRPFLELQNLAGHLLDSNDESQSTPGASVISGIGFISGARCLIFVDDSGINAGACVAATGGKFMRAINVALEKKLPFVHLVESAGANLMEYQVEMWLAGGAYMPGMSDYVVGVKGNGHAYLAGPALLKAATGEEADEEQLGGCEMHSRVSGLVEYLAEDDAHGILIVRDLIARLVDHSDFLEFKPAYGNATVCAQARVFGHTCAFIGNNGPIDPNAATKVAQFIQLCDQSDTPLVFLQNITGYMVGTEYEQAGMIKHGAKMIQAVTNAKVPRITFMVGASYGAGNYGMCGRAYHPDFLFSWPNAQIGVMGGEQAAKTMSQVMLAGAKRKGLTLDSDVLSKQESRLTQHFDAQANAFYTSGRLLDDGVIDPRDTRNVLGFVLDTCREARNRKLHANSYGVGRM
jgi:geranyl-CoA carboxylase beta subunit